MIQITLRSTDLSLPMFDHRGKKIKYNRDCWNSGFFTVDRRQTERSGSVDCNNTLLYSLCSSRSKGTIDVCSKDSWILAYVHVPCSWALSFHLLLHFPPSTTWIYFECPFEHLWARDSLPLHGFATYLLLPPDLNLSVLLEWR